MRTTHSQDKQQTRRGGPHRQSCAWRDAIGTGFATGASQRVLDMVSGRTGQDYCDR